MSNPPAWSDRDFEEARLLQRKLSELFQTALPGNSDLDSLKEVRRLCDRALLTVPDEFCQQQLCEVERHAARLFSVRGVAFHRRLILDTLEAVDARLASLERLQDAGVIIAHAEAILSKS